MAGDLCRRGSVFDVQRLLKRDHGAALDKYRVNNKSQSLRWKVAVGEVLREHRGGLFEQVGRTVGGKILWHLTQEQEAGQEAELLKQSCKNARCYWEILGKSCRELTGAASQQPRRRRNACCWRLDYHLCQDDLCVPLPRLPSTLQKSQHLP